MADFYGAPFVPTSGKIIREILEKAKLKKGAVFYELGSGDGRVLRMAVREFGVFGYGVDIHPMLIWYSKIVAKLQNIQNISFKRESFFKTDLKKAEVIFLFLLPKTLEKLSKKLGKNKKALIISHGFKISGLDNFLIDRIERKSFPTYYYRLLK